MTELLTNSSLTTFDECKRKYYHRYVLGVVTAREPDYFRIGGAYHRGLEALGQTGSLEMGVETVRGLYAEPPAWAEGNDEAIASLEVEAETVVRLLCGWHWRWSETQIEVLDTEQVFEVPILNPETNSPAKAHRFAGIRDQIVRLPDGRKALQEFKTTGDDIDPTGDYWKRLKMDSQITAYFDALGEHDVDTILYDVCRKPGIKPKKPVKKDVAEWPLYYGETMNGDIPERESAQMFGARLNADISERPERYYQRLEITRLESDRIEFRFDVWQKHKAILASLALGHWPRATRSCMLMGKCAYFDICVNGTDLEQEIPQGFVKLTHVHQELERVGS